MGLTQADSGSAKIFGHRAGTRAARELIGFLSEVTLYREFMGAEERGVYLCGHVLALALVLGLTIAGLALCLTLSLAWKTRSLDLSIGWACYGVFLQSLLVGAACMVAWRRPRSPLNSRWMSSTDLTPTG